MALIMNDEQRLKSLEAYNPAEHLISVGTNKDRTPVLYYPAAWRLYELRLRHPHFTLECEIVHMDEERGTIIVKAIGYDGLDYATSQLKGTALKQGKVSELDKVETKAMSRVARNIGIGTEYALDMDEEDAPVTRPQGKSDTAHNGTSNHSNAPVALSSEPVTSSMIDKIKTSWASVYNVADASVEERWGKYKVYVLGSSIADPDLKAAHLGKINGDIEQQRRKAPKTA